MHHSVIETLKAGLSLEGSYAVFDQMPYPILIKDSDLRFRAINRQFAVMLPKKRKDILGLTVRDLYPDMAETFEKREREVLQTGIEQSFHETLKDDQGVERDYITTVSRIDGGSDGYFVSISLNDVTALNQARLQAMAADRLKSEFLANMSHEIRTPLNGVLGMAELLLHSGLTDRQKALAEIVSSSGVQLLGVIDDVLDFSHIEAGQIKLAPDLFDLEDAVDGVVTLLATKAAEKGLDLIVHIHPSAPRRLRLDAGRLKQILTNLVGNAIKFTDEGHILVEVSARDGRLHIAVEDTGHGIPQEDREQIFKKFVRSKLRDGKVRGGAGLGLTISASLVRLMKGDIGVANADHGGARLLGL